MTKYDRQKALYISSFLIKSEGGKMAITGKKKRQIAVLTGGGDAPGLNAVIRGITIKAKSLGYDVLGILNGWKGLLEKCEHCGSARHSLLPFCDNCGREKQVEELAQESA